MVAQSDNHSCVVVLNDTTEANVSDSVFYENAHQVVFPVLKYNLPANSDFAKEMINEVFPKYNANEYKLERVVLRGAASPEGKYQLNARLAHLRKQALVNFLVKNGKYQLSPSVMTEEEMPEDYVGLVRLMKQNNDRDYDYVAKVVEQNRQNPAAIKRLLARKDGNKLWCRLFREYFPQLRTAKVMLFFSKINNVPAPVVEEPAVEEPVATPVEKPVVTPVEEPAAPAEVVMPEVKKLKEPKYPLLSIKTNLIYDFLYTPKTKFTPVPNIEVEYYFRNGNFSILGEYEFPWWKRESKKYFFQLQNWQIEPRYYFKHDHYFNGFYVAPYINYFRFDFALKGNDGSGVQGEGLGAGASVGFVLPIFRKSSRWKVEFNLKAGYFETHYDPYDYEYNEETQTGKYYYRWYDSPSKFKRRNWRYRWIGPTGAGIKVSFDLLRRKARPNWKINSKQK